MKIITGMCALGDPSYAEMAVISAESFLRENTDSDLVMFSDNIHMYDHQVERYGSRIKVIQFADAYYKHPEVMQSFDRKISHNCCNFKYQDRMHIHINVAMLPPVIQWYAEENGYDWCLKVDVDSYFNGNLLGKLKEEVSSFADTVDTFSAEQKHPDMACFNRNAGTPTAGFMMWRTASEYCPLYISGFALNEQCTYWGLLENKAHVKQHRLTYPGYHFVYPFQNNAKFSREQAVQHSPAYFHLNFLRQVQYMDQWFNPETKFKHITDWK